MEDAKFMKSYSLIALTLLPLKLFAFGESSPGISAYRAPGVDYTVYEKRVRQQHADEKFLGRSPVRIATYYSETTLPGGIGWKSVNEMQSRFEKIRDERFLEDSSTPGFPRRISWLYPKDGCFARAALFNRNAFRMYIPIPNKIFAFGNLRVKTDNSVRGAVGWWYHVAPMVQVGREKYVLDPSIEAKRPLTVHEWLQKMGNPAKIKVAVCSSGTYSPGDNCDKKTDGLELRAMNTQKHYLTLEKRELEKLGRSYVDELGDNPPWR
jgi:hypothetical protein